MQQSTTLKTEDASYAAYAALDWGDQKHAWALQVAGEQTCQRGQLAHTPEAIHEWVLELRQRFGERPIAVALEQARGALLFALSKYGNLVLYPLHPAMAARFRQAMHPSGSKDDPLDAEVQLELLLKHRDRLQSWQPDSALTRELQFPVEDRRHLVDHKTALLNQLIQRLKLYFPQVLSWCGGTDSLLLWRLLEHWPDLETMQQVPRRKLKAVIEQDGRSVPEDVAAFLENVRNAMPALCDGAVVRSSARFVQSLVQQLQALRASIRDYERRIEELVQQHPDSPIVSSFPGVGKALAPRLIAALGSRRDRFRDAASIQSYSGMLLCVKRADAGNGSMRVGPVRSSSSRPFRNGRNTRSHSASGRANITSCNERAANSTRPLSAASLINGSASCSVVGSIKSPTMTPTTRNVAASALHNPMLPNL